MGWVHLVKNGISTYKGNWLQPLSIDNVFIMCLLVVNDDGERTSRVFIQIFGHCWIRCNCVLGVLKSVS